MIKNFCNENLEGLSPDQLEQVEKLLEGQFAQIMDTLWIDWKADHNTKDTPRRIAKMLVHETFRGRFYPKPDITEFDNHKNMDQQVILGPLDVKSVCAHHWQPFIGKAWIGVMPGDTLVGLSKYPRLVDWFARRPQIQEDLTQQIVEDIQATFQPRGVIVVVKAVHFCMYCRGVNQSAVTTTSQVAGMYQASPSLKDEFLALAGITNNVIG
jgi:GTP cyclohydrolase I